MPRKDPSQILTLDLDMLKVDDRWNARNIGDPETYGAEIKKLARSIKEHGQDTPVLVRKERDGRYWLLAGFRRYHAIKDILDYKTIRVAIRESGGPLDDLYTNMRENVERKNLTTYDLAARCYLLRKEYKQDAAKIASAVSGGFESGDGKALSVSHVNRLLNYFAKLHPSILDGWKRGEKWATFNAITQSGVAAMKPDEQKDWAEKERTGKSKSDKKGAKKGAQHDKRAKRASPAMLEAALKACANSSAGESYIDGVVAALMFALGRRARGQNHPLIPKVYDPKKPKAKPETETETPAEPVK